MGMQLTGGGAASPQNQNATPEFGGWTGAGGKVTGGAQVSASASPNVKGAWTAIFTATTDIAGIVISIGQSSNSSARFAIDLGDDNSTANKLSGWGTQPGTSGGAIQRNLPLKMTAGQTLYARVASTTASANIHIGVVALEKNSQSRPGFTKATNPIATASGSATQASSVTVNFDDGTVPPTWTLLWDNGGAGTPVDYGAIMGISTEGGTTPALAQEVMVCIGYGPDAATVTDVARWLTTTLAASPINVRSSSEVFPHTIPAGSKIYAHIAAVTPGAGPDKLAVGMLLFEA